MQAKARALGHPIHPMLIVFPLGLLSVAAIFDIVYLCTNNGHWADVSFWIIAAGIIGGLVAAVFGLIDWLAIPAGTRAKYIGAGAWAKECGGRRAFYRERVAAPARPNHPRLLPIILGFAGVALAFFSGWLGGELVYRLNIAVDEGAHPDSPSSLSGRSATERVSGPRPI